METLSTSMEAGWYFDNELGRLGNTNFEEEYDPSENSIFQLPNEFKEFLNLSRHSTYFWSDLDNALALIELLESMRGRIFEGIRINTEFRHGCYPHRPRIIEFMVDSVKYMQTGSRSVDLATWRLLLDADTDNHVLNRDEIQLIVSQQKLYNELIMQVADPKLPSSFGTYISAWYSKPNGVRDLAYTIALLGGWTF